MTEWMKMAATLGGVFLATATAAACGGGDGGGGDNTGGSGGSATGTPTGTPTGLGGGLSEGQCRQDADCGDPGFEFCLSPGESIGCGACQGPPDDPCTSDDACKSLGEHYICEPLVCPCDPSAGDACRPGCTANEDCAVGFVCGSTHRCERQPCQADDDCPAQHGCGQDDQCHRNTCTSDADCDGYCVDGACYGEPGLCTEYPA